MLATSTSQKTSKKVEIMKDVEKFEKFEEMKKSEENKNQISENTHEMVEEFIQLLIRNSCYDEN